ncbi:hypothetical protein MDA_GLEAN10008931 [Myotis davidii]|uniref:Uncharacterized protein n=1 Tax=Myotis davidii TaxID=225400 RepID=L5M702_MYODS|nr:hypothetical protein MDA_GLEAN10008931 [Myotis davidii]
MPLNCLSQSNDDSTWPQALPVWPVTCTFKNPHKVLIPSGLDEPKLYWPSALTSPAWYTFPPTKPTHHHRFCMKHSRPAVGTAVSLQSSGVHVGNPVEFHHSRSCQDINAQKP